MAKARLIAHFSQYSLIAVAGPQGSGKTEVLKALYGILADFLIPNVGCGERQPLLVLERRSEGCQGYILKGQTERGGPSLQNVIAEPIEARAFRERLTKTLPGDVLPRLDVPVTHFDPSLEGKGGFVLLPGYEAPNEENNAWQDVMRHAFFNTGGALVVINEAYSAQGADEALLDDLRAHVLSVGKPVIVITGADQRSADKSVALKNAVAERLHIPPQERDRVVSFGLGAQSPSSCNEIINALQRYVMTSHSDWQKRQAATLNSIVRDELEDLLDRLHGMERSVTIEGTTGEFKIEEHMRAFGEARVQFLKEYNRTLTDGLKPHLDAAQISAEKTLEKAAGGALERVWVRVKGPLSKNEHQKRRESRKIIEDAWKASSVPAIHQKALESAMRIRYSAESATSNAGTITEKDVKSHRSEGLIWQGTASEAQWTPSSPESKKPLLRLDENFKAGLVALMQPIGPSGTRFIEVDLNSLLRALPIISAEFFRMSETVLPRIPISGATEQEVAQDFRKTFEGLGGETTEFLKAVGLIVGVDAAAIAEQGAAAALFGGGMVASGVAAAVAVALVLWTTASVCGRLETQDYEAARNALELLCEGTKAHYRQQMERLLDWVEEVLRNALNHRFGIGLDAAAQLNLTSAIADVRRAASEARSRSRRVLSLKSS